MGDWREQLNRLAVEFRYGVGSLSELSAWADAANEEMGEVHPDVWDLYCSPTPEQARNLALKIASEVNGFRPQEWAAGPFAVCALKKALERYLAQDFPIQSLCEVINEVEHTVLSRDKHRIESPGALPVQYTAWLRDLWNCCDWCDETWTFDNCPHMAVGAREALAMMTNLECEVYPASSRGGGSES